MNHKKALVTLVVGEKYQQFWKKYCQKNWQKYAEKHGYDLICISELLDNSERGKKRPPHWQKCLILSQEFSKKYERIVWLDSDVVINWQDAPCICENLPKEKVGAVRSWGSPDDQIAMTARKRMFEAYGVIGEPTLRDTYAKYGLPTEFDEIVQTGVIVFSPEHHRQILEKVYDKHEGIKEWEMFPLSYELLKANAVQWIDERFNWVWGKQMAFYYPFLMQKATDFFLMNLTKRLLRKIGVAEYRLNPVESLCVTASFKNSYFFHFAGHTHAINLVDWKGFYR